MCGLGPRAPGTLLTAAPHVDEASRMHKPSPFPEISAVRPGLCRMLGKRLTGCEGRRTKPKTYQEEKKQQTSPGRARLREPEAAEQPRAGPLRLKLSAASVPTTRDMGPHLSGLFYVQSLLLPDSSQGCSAPLPPSCPPLLSLSATSGPPPALSSVFQSQQRC